MNDRDISVSIYKGDSGIAKEISRWGIVMHYETRSGHISVKLVTWNRSTIHSRTYPTLNEAMDNLYLGVYEALWRECSG